MYIVSFYFSIAELLKILDYINIIGKKFQIIFGTRFDGVAYTDLQKFLELSENEYKEIYYVPTINDNGPSHHIKFWDDCFSISILISASFFNEIKKEYSKMESEADFQRFSDDIRKLVDGIVEELPIVGVNFSDGDEPFEYGWRQLLQPEVVNWIYFGYIYEGENFRYIQGKI